MVGASSLSKMAPFALLEEPLLVFSPTDQTHVDVHPLRGLAKFGPYSKGSFGKYASKIRIATVGPESAFKQRGTLMASLRGRFRTTDKSGYVPPFPGFERLFGIALESAPPEAHVKWPDDLDQLPGDGLHQQRIADAMGAAVRRLDAVRNDFDIVLVHFPDTWLSATRAPVSMHTTP